MQTIGQKIKILRKERGLSQEELAFALNVSRQAVSKWEQDQMLLTIERLKEICQYFGITMESLVATDGSPLKEAAAVSEKSELERELKSILETKIVETIEKEITSAVKQEITVALEKENAPDLSEDVIADVERNTVIALKQNVANAMSENTQTATVKPSMEKPSKWWIIGVVLSLLVPAGDLFAITVIKIIEALPIGFDKNAWGTYTDWIVLISIGLLTVLSLIVFIALIAYRITLFVKVKKLLKIYE